MKRIGTQALDVIAFDNSLEASKTKVILDTMKDREKLEDDGIDDQVEYMNAVNWPIERIGNGSFLIEEQRTQNSISCVITHKKPFLICLIIKSLSLKLWNVNNLYDIYLKY